MTSPLDELRKALATIDRESADATPGPWRNESGWIQVHHEDYVMAPVNEGNPRANADLIVNAVALYRETVRDIIADATYLNRPGGRGIDPTALRIARAINARTEGAS